MQTNVIYNKSSVSMPEIDDNSIDTIITSCPYWGLRDYGKGANQIWGGDKDCQHKWGNSLIVRERGSITGPTAQVGNQLNPEIAKTHSTRGQFCQLCGAWYGQLGLEPTLEMYIEHLLIITAECKRVLKPTGVLWWNHGDCYFTGKGSCNNPGGGNKSWKSWNDRKSIYPRGRGAPNRISKEIPAKCLALQNFRLIIRLIDEQGWILRNTVQWNKPNSMPSSTKNRLTNKYEPIFFLVKNTKTQYYWNEKTGLMVNRKPSKDKQKEGIDWYWIEDEKGERRKRSYWHSLDYWFDLDAIREKHAAKSFTAVGCEYQKQKGTDNLGKVKGWNLSESMDIHTLNPSGKNPGDVWTIPTQPYPEAHFATFPEKLVIKPILSSCPEWICKKCGKARVRITNTQREVENSKRQWEKGTMRNYKGERWNVTNHKTIGWTDCKCNAGWRPGITLDLFAGSGTTLAMAKRCRRQFIGYEIVKSYIPLTRKRLEKEDTMFNRDLKEQFI
jgi:DNA modification methylase